MQQCSYHSLLKIKKFFISSECHSLSMLSSKTEQIFSVQYYHQTDFSICINLLYSFNVSNQQHPYKPPEAASFHFLKTPQQYEEQAEILPLFKSYLHLQI